MVERRTSTRGRARRRLALLVVAAGAGALAACEGDTLYDGTAPGAVVPEAAIVAPEDGAEVLSGRRVPVQLTGTDASGISEMTLRVSGAFQTTLNFVFTPPRPSVTVDTAVTVPEGASGTAQFRLTATNTQGTVGQAESVQILVAAVDTVPPQVGIVVAAPDRMELTDSIVATVTAADNPGGSGIQEVGLTALVLDPAGADTAVVTLTEVFASAREDQVVQRFAFLPPFGDGLTLPDTVEVEIYGYAVDAEGVCSAGSVQDPAQSLGCSEITVDGTPAVLGFTPPPPRQIIAVAGRTALFPESGTIADLLVDTLRERVWVSNLSRNKLNTLRPVDATWDGDVFVGAEPWGLALNRGGDSLLVANSGGTSISYVALSGGAPREVLDRRYRTRNSPLFEITKGVDANGRVRLEGVFIDFSDRPQFIAQDANGRVLYSTRPTDAAPLGTIRVAESRSSWSEPETRILLRLDDVNFEQFGEDTVVVAIANVDSVHLVTSGANANDRIIIYDHENGFPNRVVSSGVLPLEEALDEMTSNPDSDIFWRYGSWDVPALSLSDTTYVSASGDREWVAFGEGGASPGRITLWDASAQRIHSRLLVADLVNNASETVRGIDLNEDGSLGAARGNVASYFFGTDLRLQGSVAEVTQGGNGTVLHPDHPDFPAGASSPTTLAFLGAGDNTIKILDTVHFTQRGEIHIRDEIVGPFRAGPPLDSDNGGQGRNCGGPDCVVAKLYGVTSGGGVVVVNVRRSDIQPIQ